MCNENNNNQETVAKKSHVTTTMISEVTGTSQSMVSQVLNGKRNKDTDTAQRIEVAQMLLEEKFPKLLEEVKKLVAVK